VSFITACDIHPLRDSYGIILRGGGGGFLGEGCALKFHVEHKLL